MNLPVSIGFSEIQNIQAGAANDSITVLGTASYLSPEQAQGTPVDARTDIYSLGTVLYELLTGRPPFTGDSSVAVAYKQVNETPALTSSLNPEVPARLDAVVMKALSKNPSNRYQSAEEFSADRRSNPSTPTTWPERGRHDPG